MTDQVDVRSLEVSELNVVLENLSIKPYLLRFASSEDEVKAAQRLRYEVFFEEREGRATDADTIGLVESDKFDSISEHLLVYHCVGTEKSLVGCYRILSYIDNIEEQGSKEFYSEKEFDIRSLKESGLRLMELSRSCVKSGFRDKNVIDLLWRGISVYILGYELDLMFGCASFMGTDIERHRMHLSYLHHNHLAPLLMRARALEGCKAEYSLYTEEESKGLGGSLPPLIKGYLRLGGWIGEGAVADTSFNTIDIMMIVATDQVNTNYYKRYARVLEKNNIRINRERVERIENLVR